MNVTVKLPDKLVRAARHRAVDESKSLSAWLAELVSKELKNPSGTGSQSETWMDAFSGEHPEWFFEKNLPLENRKSGSVRELVFEDPQ